MFPVSDFLIYCFVTAYTPGANNLLSMSNAARLGFRKSFRFNLGITAGFLIIMSVCTFFSLLRMMESVPKAVTVNESSVSFNTRSGLRLLSIV